MNENNNNISTLTKIDADEFSVAEKESEGSANCYTHIFRKPFAYMGKVYKELHFDWESLTGRVGLEIEAEMQALGTPVIVPAFSGAYLVRMAAKACTESVSYDAFELMQLSDYNKIMSAARSFLLVSE